MKKSFWFIVAINILIIAIIFIKNPLLLSSKSLISQRESLIWNPVEFSSLPVEDDSGLNYRNSPQRRGVFPVKAIPHSFKRLWLTPEINSGIHSASKASALSDGKYIFVGGDTSWFYCFNTLGEPQWKFYGGESWQGIHSTAAVDSNSVYFGTYRGAFYRLDKATGRIVWFRHLGDTVGASPLIVDDALIVAVETTSRNGYVLKIKRQTAEIIWRSEFLGEQSHSSPALSEDGKLLFLGANNNTFFALENATGKIKWRTFLDGKIKSTPLVQKNQVLITTWGGTLYSLDSATGKITWKFHSGASSQVSPTFLDKKGLVVFSNIKGALFAVDFKTGRKVFELPFQIEKNLASPIVLKSPEDERILALCETRRLCLINDSGKIQLKLSLSGRMTSSPFISDNRLYISLNESGLEAFAFN